MDENASFDKDLDGPIPNDVEEEANSYYEKMYRGILNINKIVHLLQQMKSSSSQRQNDVYRCMIKNLFDEYAYFNKYPDRELAITSALFGQLINNLIVTSRSLGRALRYVYDSLKQQPDSKLFKFGSQALQEFVHLIPSWPSYVSLLLNIKQLKMVAPELFNHLSNANAHQKNKKAIAAYTLATEAVLAEAAAETGAAPPLFRSLNLKKLQVAASNQEVPVEKVQDKILFTINNISFDNIDSKIDVMRQTLKENYYEWFSNYIVVKRASIEPNYHPLYVLCIEKLGSKLLLQFILCETLKNCQTLLNSEKTVTSSSERTLLKNLGIWLGSLTLARDKPIKHRYLSFKDLLMEGYACGRLIVVIPFVCKVLERVKDSRVFKPPNPWLMGVMHLLAELYHYADLKLNLKFEIEVLCKNICLDIKDLEPTNKLRSSLVSEADEVSSTVSQPQAVEKMTLQLQRTLQAPSASNSSANPSAAIRSGGGNTTGSLGYPSLASYITVNPQIPLFQAQPNLKRVVHIAIERGIREIMAPVIERSVTIAEIATRDLVVKDFALEPNEERMKHSSQCMAQALAGSLASVTCRESLRLSCLTHLRSLFLQNGISEQAMPEQALYVLVAENLDAACMIMERLAGEKAIAQIDESLAENYIARKKHRMSSNQPFFDVTALTGSRYPAALPDSIRATQLGISATQMQVYEDFAKITSHTVHRATNLTSPNVSLPATPVRNVISSSGPPTSVSAAIPMNTGQTASNSVAVNAEETEGVVFKEESNAQAALDKWASFVADVEHYVKENRVKRLEDLTVNPSFSHMLRQLPAALAPYLSSDLYAIVVCQKVLQMVFTAESLLLQVCFALCLETLCAVNKKVAKEVANWVLYSDSPQKFVVAPMLALVKSNLVSLQELDMQLARFIEADYSPQMSFVVELMEHCVLTPSTACATAIDFLYSLHALTLLSEKKLLSGHAQEVYENITDRGLCPSVRATSEPALKDELSTVFTEWVRLYHHPRSNELLQLRFIADLQKQGWIQGSDTSSLFFRLATEISVENFLKQKAANQHVPLLSAYQAVDAYASLIVFLIRFCPFDDATKGSNCRLNLTTKILSIVVLVLVHSHERRRESFNQRPFFRLFSSMLRFLAAQESNLGGVYFSILSAFSSTFHTLQPLFLPGFTLAWLQLIASRNFMLKLLLAESNKGWSFYQKMLVDLFQFLAPFLRQQDSQTALVLTDSVRLIYRGTLRLLLVLLHDFPEFLSEYHFNFVDVIPANCVQLRNLILSAFPRTMRLPDPFTPNLGIDNLPEMAHSPRVLSDYTLALVNCSLKADLDNFLSSSGNVSKSPFLANLPSMLRVREGDVEDDASLRKSLNYNVSLINSLVFYTGIQATSGEHSLSAGIADALAGVVKDIDGSKRFGLSNPCICLFVHLARELDVEGRYHLFGAMANHLRYPNSHTHFFSTLLLYLFATTELEIIQEQITRVLLERLIVNRPHPYGLLITFVELTRRPQYNFWDHTNFIRCAPEIERLFESVARSISQGYSKEA